jgi:hypothetical protein
MSDIEGRGETFACCSPSSITFVASKYGLRSASNRTTYG